MLDLPIAIGALSVVYNLPGAYLAQRVPEGGAGLPGGFALAHPIRLSASIVAAVYCGTVRRWNDPAIARLNPSVTLPALRITVVCVAAVGDADMLVDQWLTHTAARRARQGLGAGDRTPARWAGCDERVPGDALAAAIRRTPDTIGVVSFDDAIANNLQAAALQNAAGAFVAPSLDSLAHAVRSALGDGSGSGASLLAARDPRAFALPYFASFVVPRDLRRVDRDPAVRRQVRDFLAWLANRQGGQLFILATEYTSGIVELRHGYLPLPDALAAAVEASIGSVVM